MNVLSLFDGISCGQIALNKVGIKYENYFASEIDKYAIKVTQKNYPKTVQLGDVSKIKGDEFYENNYYHGLGVAKTIKCLQNSGLKCDEEELLYIKLLLLNIYEGDT